jgi:hypothetical protein
MITRLYRWIHRPTGKTGTRERNFLHEKAFEYCLEFWNGGRYAAESEWQYFPVSSPDPNCHEKDKDGEIYIGPFQFWT